MNRSPLFRTLMASAALSLAVLLGGCETDGTWPVSEKAMRPLSQKMIKDIEAKNMDKDSPILVRAFKEESELEVWKQDRTGRFALLKSYPICRWSGELGPKLKEGDRQAPEGFYNITPGQMNPNSQFYLSFDLGYPNAYDRSHGRTGSQLMVHGDCSSRGCYSMTDEQISEIYALGRESFFGGQKSFQVQAYPFRMTPQNLARHRSNPHMAFWKMLKRGNDHFEVTRLEPKVDVCEKRYVFDAQSPGDATRPLSFRASDKCPVYEVPEEIVQAVAEKQKHDEQQAATLIARGTPLAPVKTYADGGMHPVFVDVVKRNQVGIAPQPTAFSLASTAPGTVPATVRPPRIPELADTHVMTASTPAATEAPRATNSAPVRAAAAEPATATPAAPMKLFGNLFASKPAAAAEPEKKADSPLDRMAKMIGLRGSAPEAKPDPVPAPKPRPAARPAPTATAAAAPARPKPAEAEPVRVATPQPAHAAAPQQPPTALAPQAPAATATTAMRGAAPVAPSGAFQDRWSAFR